MTNYIPDEVLQEWKRGLTGRRPNEDDTLRLIHDIERLHQENAALKEQAHFLLRELKSRPDLTEP